MATQQSTQVRKYVTSADSFLSDSSNAGRGELQRILGNAGGNPARLDDEALASVRALVTRAAALLREGTLPPSPDPRRCAVCPARRVCAHRDEREPSA